MTAYLISASGCDDATKILAELTDTEAETVRRLAELINAASTYGCMPTLHIKPVGEAEEWEIEETPA